MPRNNAAVAACLAATVVFAALAVYFAVATTSFLASTTAHHYKHAVLFAGLAVVSLVGASLSRPRAAA